MFDISHILVNKLVLNVARRPGVSSDWDILDLIWGTLYDQVCEFFQLSAAWNTFTRGGKFSSQDDCAKAQTAYTAPDEGHALWAIQLKLRDPNIPRRRWVYHIGIRRLTADSATLYYAQCCYDHMAGSINEPKVIPYSRDPLPDSIFFNDHVQCMCGKEVLPTEALELSHATMPDFIDILRDELRAIPVLLITCTWLLTPEILQDSLLGNVVVYWCDDSNVIMRLNSILPQDMYTPWDSVHVFVPVSSDKAYHPIYTDEDIRRIGDERFIAGLRQAYCQSLRAEDQRNFINLSEVCRCRDRAYINTLLAQAQKQSEEISELQDSANALMAENKSLNEKVQMLSARKTDEEISEYESLLNEVMAEADALKEGISALSTRLYSSMGIGFQPEESEPIALIQELQHAIYACLACAGSRK